MSKRAITPAANKTMADHLNMSPAILSGEFVFLTGTTGSDASGHMPADPATQFRSAFAKIAGVLAEAGTTMHAVVEMTTYHVGLRDHFELFDAVRLEYFEAPYPAWTAVEVAGLRRDGAVVEIRVIARAPNHP